jgi:endonuclease/exonuclease/phosphatase (EEP) superfamily protein YafD
MVQHATEINVSQAPVGDLCASQIVMDDGREFLMIIVYISPSQKINDITAFLHRRLLPYSHEGSMLLKDNLDKLPLLLAGDFNVNFARDNSLQLITFLQEKFSLHINNDPREATTRYGSALDGVFTRYLDNVMSRTFVAYFSYHRPIVTLIPAIVPLEASTATVTKITDEATDNID